MSQTDKPDIIPPSPSASEYDTDPAGKPLIPDTSDPIGLFKEWMAAAREAELNDSNAMSLAKGQQLTETPKAALGFHWKSQRRQVRVRGTVTPVSEEESDEYFATRAAQSRISAIASDQSRPLTDRGEFEQRVAELSEIFGDGPDIPRPEFWGGFRVTPLEIEFWQDQAFRMHDRLKFVREGDGWTSGRLYP